MTQPDPNMICMAIETWPNDGDFAPREGDVVGYEEAPAGDDPRPRWRRVIVLGDTRTDSGVEYYHVKRCCDGYEFYLRLDQMKSWGRLQAISAAMEYLTSLRQPLDRAQRALRGRNPQAALAALGQLMGRVSGAGPIREEGRTRIVSGVEEARQALGSAPKAAHGLDSMAAAIAAIDDELRRLSREGI